MTIRGLGTLGLLAAMSLGPLNTFGGGLGASLQSVLDGDGVVGKGSWSGAFGVLRSGAVPVIISGDVDVETLADLGVEWHSQFGQLTTGWVSKTGVPILARQPGVSFVSLACGVRPSLDVSMEVVGAAALRGHLGGGEWVGHTGAGVIIGIIDSGIDVVHQDFVRPDGSSRILFVWDQASEEGTPPQELNASYGSEWSGMEIQNGLSHHYDFVGHGTHVAGIAAGNGSAAGNGENPYRYVGMAPEADIIVVAAELREDRILDALNYLQVKADALGKPLVVNMSLNTVSGPRNGMAPLSQAVDRFAASGRIVVASAGNAGGDSTHASCSIPPGQKCTLGAVVRFVEPGVPQSPADTLQSFELEMYYPAGDSAAVSLRTPAGDLLGPIPFGEVLAHTQSPSGTVFLAHVNSIDPSLKHILIEVSNIPVEGGASVPVQGGEWQVIIDNLGTDALGLHAWVGRSFPMTVRWTQGHDPSMELGAPATAHKVVAVGSYNSKRCWGGLEGEECAEIKGPGTQVGEVSWFSSNGPTADGRLKPDIGAPGFAVMSSFSGTMLLPIRTLWGVPRTLARDGVHVMQAGTSMSAPHVTGAIALALAEDGGLSPQDILGRLKDSATKDYETGNGWHPAVGHGKLNVPGFVKADSLTLPPPPRFRAAPNPFRTRTELVAWGLQGEPGHESRATIYDVQGRVVNSLDFIFGNHGEGSVSWEGTRYSGEAVAPGIYWVRFETADGEGIIKVVRLP